jgi:hypothetical protein
MIKPLEILISGPVLHMTPLFFRPICAGLETDNARQFPQPKARQIMTILRNTTAALTLAAGLTALPFVANAQILGGGSGQIGGSVGGVTGQVQGGLSGQAGIGGVQNTLGNTTHQVDDAANRVHSDVDTARQQAGDTVQQAQDAARVDGNIEAKDDANADSAAPQVNTQTNVQGNAGIAVDPGAVTGAAASGVNSVANDVNTVTGQAADTANGAAASADLSAGAKADAEAGATVEKK